MRISDPDWIEWLNSTSDTYVVAEIGNNHQGKLGQALKMMRVAKDCGANAVKFQKRNNITLYTQQALDAPYTGPQSFGATYGEHREALELNTSDMWVLFDEGRKIGIDVFCTVFDETSAMEMLRLEAPAYKIASGQMMDKPLLDMVAKFGKPMIISTGGWSLGDVIEILGWVLPVNPQVVLLQCTAEYPARWDHLNLSVIPKLKKLVGEHLPVGWSGHDNGIAMAVAARALGAKLIEKHFTLDRTSQGTDHAMSLEPQGLAKMVRDLRRFGQAIGDGRKRPWPEERGPISKMSRQWVVNCDLPKGHILTKKDLSLKIPGGSGFRPQDLYYLVDHDLATDVEKDHSPSVIAKKGDSK